MKLTIPLLAMFYIGCGSSVQPASLAYSVGHPKGFDADAERQKIAQHLARLEPQLRAPNPYDFQTHLDALKVRRQGIKWSLFAGDPQAFDAHRAAGRNLVRTIMKNGGFATDGEIRFDFGSALDGTPSRAALLTYDAPITGAVSDAIFSRCRAERRDAAVSGLCPEFGFGIATPPGEDARQALGAVARRMAQTPYAPEGTQPGRSIEFRPLRFVSGEHSLLGSRFVEAQTTAGVLLERQTLAVAFKRGDRMLVATCFTESRAKHRRETIDGACRDMVATLIRRPVPPKIIAPPRVFPLGTFAGTALQTPAGCQRNGLTERIRCGGGGQLSWQVEGVMTRDARIKTIIESLERIPTNASSLLIDRAMRCSVSGVETTCIHIQQDLKDAGYSVHYYLAKATVRGEQLLTICSGNEASPEGGPPPPCDQVLDWSRALTGAAALQSAFKRGQALMNSRDFKSAHRVFHQLLAQHVNAEDTAQNRDMRAMIHGALAQALRGMDANAHGSPAYCAADRNPKHAEILKHTAQARGLLTRNCSAGHAQSCANLGVMILTDDCGPKTGMADAYTKACEGGALSACVELGNLHMAGEHASKEPKTATALYQKACDAKLAEGCAHLAFQYDLGKGVAVDGKRAIQLLTDACDAGSMTGCNGLGLLYQRGRHVERDFQKAAALFERACAGRHPHACARLGDFAYHGEGGLESNPELAVRLWDRACQARSGHGCLSAGAAHERGDGVEANIQTAVRLYDMACRLGHPSGCFNLGNEYAKGRVLPQSFDRAKTYWQRACARGHERACAYVKMH